MAVIPRLVGSVFVSGSRQVGLILVALSLSLVAGCGRHGDFTGFWKTNCSDAFGVQIEKQSGNIFSVSFCGPGGCDAPGQWMPNTAIIGDPKYRVINATTLEIQYGEGWHRFAKCTTDTRPVLDYANMPSSNPENGPEKATPEPSPGDSTKQAEKDPHRPPCTDASCQKIAAFLKQRYCGESPAGNGPDDGCDLRDREKRGTEVRAVADYSCQWNESTNASECTQQGQVEPEVRKILLRQLEQQGLPANAPGELYFKIWKSDRVSWLLAEADYSHLVGSDIELCEVIAVIDSDTRVTVVRKLPFVKTDADVPTTTDWSLLDLADTRGSGDIDIVLVADAYEDHWFEVISVKNGSAKTIFSGLGYYL